ncbi:MAG: hypothetical protein ACT6T0_00965, partial [Nevskia sp.]
MRDRDFSEGPEYAIAQCSNRDGRRRCGRPPAPSIGCRDFVLPANCRRWRQDYNSPRRRRNSMSLRVTALLAPLFADRRRLAVAIPALCVLALASWAIGKNLVAFFKALAAQSLLITAATLLGSLAAGLLIWRARGHLDLHRERLLLLGGRVQDAIEVLAPAALATTVFLAGAVLLISGATPAIDSRLAGLA